MTKQLFAHCPFCGEPIVFSDVEHEGSVEHYETCRGVSVIAISQDPLTVVVGILERSDELCNARSAAELLAGSMRRLRKQFPDQRFQVMPFAETFRASDLDSASGFDVGQSFVTALLAIAE